LGLVKKITPKRVGLRRNIPRFHISYGNKTFILHSESGLQSAPPQAKNQMPAKTPKPRYMHRPVRGMPERMESYCMRCQQFVAASDKPKTLRIAEKAHICPERNPQK
jgi:hypothetical protein